ncbi:relaxase/mobilization nuclease domain-containing protein [Pedobacter sp. UYEF25]
MDQNKGELMKIQNFGPLQGMENLKPEDYRNYFKLISSQNTRIKAPQFHVAISCKGKEYDKVQLTNIATRWLNEMGYSKNPYMIVFHKDTENNHVHIVSTRVNKEGKKISSEFEKIRAVQNINKVMGIDEHVKVSADVEKALKYKFSTKAQFMMLLERNGYTLKQTNKSIEVIKFGKKLLDINLETINDKILNFKIDSRRATQLGSIFEKYVLAYNTEPLPKTIALPSGLKKNTDEYTSDFSEFIKQKFGIELIYHGKDGKSPYGYSIIDHAEQNVFKGGEVITLKELLNVNSKSEQERTSKVSYNESKSKNKLSIAELNYYSTLLKASLYNYPALLQGLSSQGLVVDRQQSTFYLNDVAAGIKVNIKELLDFEEFQIFAGAYQIHAHSSFDWENLAHFATVGSIHLVDDQDDAKRKKKRKT